MVYEDDWIDTLYPPVEGERMGRLDNWFHAHDQAETQEWHEDMDWLVEGWLPVGYLVVAAEGCRILLGAVRGALLLPPPREEVPGSEQGGSGWWLCWGRATIRIGEWRRCF
jgi:hypothetical protein